MFLQRLRRAAAFSLAAREAKGTIDLQSVLCLRCPFVAAQTWIMQVLHEYCEDVINEPGSSPELITDGSILCRVVNSIVSGSVEVIHDDDSYESRVSYCGNSVVQTIRYENKCLPDLVATPVFESSDDEAIWIFV